MPGDVVLVRVGDVVPADLRLTRVERLTIDRSVLTGESLPEPGRDRTRTRPAPPSADRRSIAYAGTSVVGGRGEGVVVAIGSATELGRIASGLSTKQRHRSPLQRELDRLVRILLVVAVGLIAITTGLGFARGNPLGENLLAGISAAIAAIPEEPPVLLAVILGLGAFRLLRRGVLVRRLNAEEVLGAVDLVVTDKTGTLTENRLEVVSVAGVDGPVGDEARRRVVLLDALRAEDDAWHGRWRSRGDELVHACAGDRRRGRRWRPPPGARGSRRGRAVRRATAVHHDHRAARRRAGDPRHRRSGSGLRPASARTRPSSWHGRLEAAAARGERVVALSRR